MCTGESDARSSDNACLNNSILLPSEGLLQQPTLTQKGGPRLDKKEPQQPRRHVQRGYNPGSQVEFHDNEREQDSQHEADDKST